MGRKHSSGGKVLEKVPRILRWHFLAIPDATWEHLGILGGEKRGRTKEDKG